MQFSVRIIYGDTVSTEQCDKQRVLGKVIHCRTGSSSRANTRC